MSKTLVIFDFDWSLIDENSDTFVFQELASKSLRAEMKLTLKTGKYQWTDFMDTFLGKLHDEGVTRGQLVKALERIPFREDMIAAIRLAKSRGAELIILSDANSVFIEVILASYGCTEIFSHIVTNPATFSEAGRLSVRRWVQPDAPHGCDMCHINMCKGRDLEEYANGKHFDRKVYIGDSKNDLCPSTRLSKADHVLARSDCDLLTLLSAKPSPTQATVHPWATATDVLNVFTTLFN